jgi:uncharacterized repeat protein (TIGR02543 family)
MYNYLDKFKGQDGRMSVYDILSLNGTEVDEKGNIILHKYEAVDIHKVKIDGRTFTNYGAYQFIWEKTFVKSPERSQSGSLGNLNSYTTFLTPHLILDFSVMSIDDYRAIMQMHYERNEFTVECYDPIYNTQIRVKMYFATEEMAKLYTINKIRLNDQNEWEDWIELVGVQEYKVELIGTNNELDLVSVYYKYNAPLDDSGNPIYPDGSPIPDQAEEDIYLGEEIVIGQNSTFQTTPPSADWQFSHWTMFNGKDEALGIRNNGLVMTVNFPIYFQAEWKPTTTHTLSFNYGLSDVAYEVDLGTGVRTEILNEQVQEGELIRTLPALTVEPSVLYNGKLEYPYYNGGWYKSPSRQSERVYVGTTYWTNRDTIIYALYEKKLFDVVYHTNDPLTELPTQKVAYDEIVYLPTLYREGYKFQGWYLNADFSKSFSGNKMPPYSIDLYAGWVAE